MATETRPAPSDPPKEQQPPAFAPPEGVAERKIGVEEFFSLAERFGFTEEALQRLRAAVSDEDLRGHGPNLARYKTAFPRETQGPAFEALAHEHFGTAHALGTSSGTGALHAALVGVGTGPGTEVIVPAVGFVATGMAAALAGADVVVCDVDESMHMDPAALEALISARTVAIVPTHVGGYVADLAPLCATARRHGVAVVEDCAQAPGAAYDGRPVGTLGDVGCFSISAYKVIGGGEGGLIITDDETIFDRANQVVESGGLWRPDRCAAERFPGELLVGTNYRMSELEAAVDVVQLAKLERFVENRRRVFQRVARQLPPCAALTPPTLNDPAGVFGPDLHALPRDHALGHDLVQALKAEGVPAGRRGPDAGPDWHVARDMHPLRGRMTADPATAAPRAADLYDRRLTIRLNPAWSDATCDACAAAIHKVLTAYAEPDEDVPPWFPEPAGEARR
jgi:dTDP-4-amino-4,6-dideoxygalactose transaminase